ncbi:MAG: class I SAM-dependent methyltransferase [Candidatus Rokubacteria bacterium]|nr:class I SAM-dependent methyltransferase [Candidatus Rokubacteria bacterium]
MQGQGERNRSVYAAVPWWAKIAVKSALVRVPVPRRVWRRMGLFVPGLMRDPSYATRVVEAHLRLAGAPRPGFTWLELGPGDSVASAVVAWAHGAAGGWLIDSRALATMDMAVYRPLVASLAARALARDVRPLADAVDVPDLLRRTNARYLTEGVASLRQIADATVDIVFSQAVLEHVPLDGIDATFRELFRVQTPGGHGSHRVDFRDHLQNSLHNLRFSQAVWEKPWFAARGGFYTNRLRLSQIVVRARAAGFVVEVVDRDLFPALPLPRPALAPMFRDLSDDDLLTRGAGVVWTRP